jgi:hypothetical protein
MAGIGLLGYSGTSEELWRMDRRNLYCLPSGFYVPDGLPTPYWHTLDIGKQCTNLQQLVPKCFTQ